MRIRANEGEELGPCSRRRSPSRKGFAQEGEAQRRLDKDFGWVECAGGEMPGFANAGRTRWNAMVELAMGPDSQRHRHERAPSQATWTGLDFI